MRPIFTESLVYETLFNPGVGGLLVQRSIWASGDVPLKWVSKLASWYNDDPLFSEKTGMNMGYIFEFSKIGTKIGPISSI